MAIWDDAKGILGIVAPTIGTALGGPLGGLAVTSLCTALGLNGSSTDAQIAQAVKTANPDQLLAIKTAENNFVTTMNQLQVDLASLTNDDKASARDREVAIRDKTPSILGYATVAAFFATCFLVLLGWAKVDGALAGTLIGYMSAKAQDVYSYFFGSNAGSAGKTQTIANSVPLSAISMLTQGQNPLMLPPTQNNVTSITDGQ